MKLMQNLTTNTILYSEDINFVLEQQIINECNFVYDFVINVTLVQSENIRLTCKH